MFEQRLLESIRKNAHRHCAYVNSIIYSYKDFEKYVARIQNVIVNSCNSGVCIGVEMHNDIYTYASIIAVLLSGCAYVVINPNIPFERNHHIIEKSGIVLLLSSSLHHHATKFSSILDVRFIDIKTACKTDNVYTLVVSQRLV